MQTPRAGADRTAQFCRGLGVVVRTECTAGLGIPKVMVVVASVTGQSARLRSYTIPPLGAPVDADNAVSGREPSPTPLNNQQTRVVSHLRALQVVAQDRMRDEHRWRSCAQARVTVVRQRRISLRTITTVSTALCRRRKCSSGESAAARVHQTQERSPRRNSGGRITPSPCRSRTLATKRRHRHRSLVNLRKSGSWTSRRPRREVPSCNTPAETSSSTCHEPAARTDSVLEGMSRSVRTKGQA